jgi:predicted MFS family arabinose efflux permease
MASSDLRRGRLSATVVFFATGLVSATWTARIPAVQDRLGLSAGQLALAVLAIEGGALVGLPMGAALVTRGSSRRSLQLAFVVFAPALLVAVVMPGLGSLVLALPVWAAANSVIDVAVNTQGVELERRYGRPLLSGLHAAHSFGLLAGGLMAFTAISGGLSLEAHVATVGAVTLAAVQWASRRLLDEAAAPSRPVFARPDRRVWLLGAMAFCAFLIDGAANNWTAVHLRSEHHASAAVAAAGFTVFACTLAVGRLLGDRLIRRAGRVRALRLSGALTAAGGGLAIAAPSLAVAFAGWAVVGAGLAVIAPAILGAAPDLTDAPAGGAIAAVTSIGYLGSFTGPPLIGALAQLSDLSTALALLVVAATVVALLADRVLPRQGGAACG